MILQAETFIVTLINTPPETITHRFLLQNAEDIRIAERESNSTFQWFPSSFLAWGHQGRKIGHPEVPSVLLSGP